MAVHINRHISIPVIYVASTTITIAAAAVIAAAAAAAAVTAAAVILVGVLPLQLLHILLLYLSPAVKIRC